MIAAVTRTGIPTSSFCSVKGEVGRVGASVLAGVVHASEESDESFGTLQKLL